MFSKETYIQRRAELKKQVGSGVLLFLGNDDMGLNYEDNAYRYREDSSFLYCFGMSGFAAAYLFIGWSQIIAVGISHFSLIDTFQSGHECFNTPKATSGQINHILFCKHDYLSLFFRQYIFLRKSFL